MSSNPTLINALKTKQWRCRERWRIQCLVVSIFYIGNTEVVWRSVARAGHICWYRGWIQWAVSNFPVERIKQSLILPSDTQHPAVAGRLWGDQGQEGESTISSDTTNHCSFYFRGTSLTDVEIRNYCSPCGERAAASSLTKPGMKSKQKHKTQEDWTEEIIWDT